MTEDNDEKLENERKQIVKKIDAEAKKEHKSGLVMAAEKNKPNITALIIDVKLRDGTLNKNDLEAALKALSAKNLNNKKETENSLIIGKAELEAKEEGKPVLIFLAEKDNTEIMKLIIDQKEKFGTLKLTELSEALETASQNKNKDIVEILKDTQKRVSLVQCDEIKKQLSTSEQIENKAYSNVARYSKQPKSDRSR
jgi:hypothetical protein